MEMEYKLMELERLQYFCIVDIKSEFVPEAYEKDNHYLVTYTIMELNTLEKLTIKEKIPVNLINDNVNNEFEGTLASIMLENGVTPFDMNYKQLCKYGVPPHKSDNVHDICISPKHYFFNGIILQEPVTEWEHILHIPSSERQANRIQLEINTNLEWLAREISENTKAINETLMSIDKAHDLTNYVLQTR